MTVEEVLPILASLDASDWPVFTISGEAGVWIKPKMGLVVEDFTNVLFGLGNDWVLAKDPR